MRRVPPNKVKWDDDRPQSDAFVPASGDSKMSADAEWIVLDKGHDTSVCISDYPGFGLVALPIGLILELGLEYEVDGTPDPWHTGVWLSDDDGQIKSDFPKSTKRRLAREAEWVIRPTDPTQES